jgi:hypothetical protein
MLTLCLPNMCENLCTLLEYAERNSTPEQNAHLMFAKYAE